MVVRGSGANRADTRAPRRKVSLLQLGTGGVAARRPIRKPANVVAASTTSIAPPIQLKRLFFVGIKTADFELSRAGAARNPESVTAINCREDDWRSRCRRLRSP